jgi:hypothetical protein
MVAIKSTTHTRRRCKHCRKPIPKPKRGRSSTKYCGTPCRRRHTYDKKAGKSSWRCEECGEPIVGRRKRFDKPECQEAAYYRAKNKATPPAVGWNALLRYRDLPMKSCEHCGKKFHPRPNEAGRYHSRECAFAAQHAAAVARGGWTKEDKLERKKRQEIRTLQRTVRDRARRQRQQVQELRLESVLWNATQERLTRKKLDSERELFCEICGVKFVLGERPSNTVTCGRDCSRRLARKITREHKRRRQAWKNGSVREREPYEDREIFVRDKWRCKLCGRKVDRSKVVPHPDAPTIDHVIPLSKLGFDAPANVQCAHFSCNCRKSDAIRTLW